MHANRTQAQDREDRQLASVTIPTEICELLKLNPKDTLEFTATNGDIIIRKGKS